MPNTPPVAAFAIEAEPLGPAGPVAWFRAITADAGGRTALAFLVFLAIVALFAPLLAPYDPIELQGPIVYKSQPPSLRFWFGTDQVSRDVLSRMMYGATISLGIAVLAATLSAVVGLAWGATAGFFGGWIDAALMRTVDTFLAIPRVLLVLTVVALWTRPSVAGLIVVLGLTGWFGVSRLARAEALVVRSRDFVSAARALGVSRRAILVRHVIPHALGPVLVAATVAIGNVIVLEAGLSFFNVGVRDPTASWGTIIRDGRESLALTWWMTVFPGLALIGTSLAVNSVASRLRSAINPRQLPGR
ncbi:MAG: ABC transporter permease [Gemmatimonadaceae bacterium]